MSLVPVGGLRSNWFRHDRYTAMSTLMTSFHLFPHASLCRRPRAAPARLFTWSQKTISFRWLFCRTSCDSVHYAAANALSSHASHAGSDALVRVSAAATESCAEAVVESPLPAETALAAAEPSALAANGGGGGIMPVAPPITADVSG
eukprot:GHVU01058790.1.p1 GENE.GHVU01058790.1~~GHVU01058790.1.p1  ORF type:complete len:147 (-),score=5.13 GHVU01058790.1:286-726(-)